MIRAARAASLALTTLAAGAGAATMPRGGEILFTLSSADATHPALYAMRADGSHLRLVVPNASDAAVSRDGKKIAFVRSGAIWSMRSDGAGQRQVTRPTNGHEDSDPAWSANGQELYFSRLSRRTLTAPLYVVGADGTGERRLTSAPANTGMGGSGTCDQGPAVAPGGATVTFVVVAACSHGTGSSIAVIDPSGHRVPLGLRLADPAAADGAEYLDPAWAPTGRRLAYGVGSGDMPFTGLFLSVAGKAPRQLAEGGTGWMGGAAWSPDGRWIAFVRGGNSGHGLIGLVRPDGSGLTYLVRRGTNDTEPAWLP